MLFVALTIFVQGQNTLEGTVRHLATDRVSLYSYYGERASKVDSVLTDSSGHFRFILSPQRLPGMYRVQWGKNEKIDLIWNRENILFKTTRDNPEDSLKIISSMENKINRDYSLLDRINQTRLQLLMPVVDYYPVRDSFYTGVVNEMEGIQRKQQAFYDSLVALYPDAFAVRMAGVYQTPFIPAALDKEQRINFLKQHYFDLVNFSDTALLRTTAFPNKAISYLSLYSNNRLTQKQLETEFIKAVTIMLSAASVNAEVFKYWLDYLVNGFDKFHFDEVITYIADNFQDPYACEDQTRKSALQKRLDTFKKLAIGNPALPLEVPDTKGKPVRLSDISAEYTLLVFWSTQCPHCVAMMPRLKEIYNQQKTKRFEVIAVSIDTSRTAWTGFLKENKLNWINGSELKGYAAKSCDDYNIYATPTLFLLDREKKIISKPVSLRETEQALRDNNLMD
jgi:peroxiredoxin